MTIFSDAVEIFWGQNVSAPPLKLARTVRLYDNSDRHGSCEAMYNDIESCTGTSTGLHALTQHHFSLKLKALGIVRYSST